MTTNLTVVGSPIDHSLSPVLHEAAYQMLGLDFAYEKNEVAKGQLAGFLRAGGFKALSVTMPLKQEAFALATSRSEEARLTQVVNSLVFSEGKWIGDNTDVFGLSKVFSKVENVEQIHIIGSGATTRSALLAISSICPRASVIVSARNREALSDVIEFADSLGLVAEAKGLDLVNVAESSLTLSLVPSGSMSEFWKLFAESGATPKGMFFDVNYTPWPTEPARSWGVGNSISGLEMLIWQAIAQVRFFTKHLGVATDFKDEDLYKVMTAAVSSR